MMQGTYYKEWSNALGREMEFKVYGTAGAPVLVLPCGGGRFYDWEDQGMLEASAWLLESGKIQLFCADSLPPELEMAADVTPRRRAELQEKYFNYITRELADRILALNGAARKTAAPAEPAPKAEKAGKEAKKEETVTGIWCVGTDLGAWQAMNLRLRRPDLFCGAIALSGLFDPSARLGSAQDDLALRNTPAAYLAAGLSGCTAPKLLAAEGRMILCAGQGGYEAEALASTQQMQAALQAAGIPEHTEIWGQDVSHDWYWWAKEWNIFSERLFH